jgi:hypothetical protein
MTWGGAMKTREERAKNLFEQIDSIRNDLGVLIEDLKQVKRDLGKNAPDTEGLLLAQWCIGSDTGALAALGALEYITIEDCLRAVEPAEIQQRRHAQTPAGVALAQALKTARAKGPGGLR